MDPALGALCWLYCTKFRYRKHWIAGSGEHGCLYDYGPNLHTDYQSAVDDLASLFELGRTRKARLFADHYLELDPRKDGASYCEITECDCQDPSEHWRWGGCAGLGVCGLWQDVERSSRRARRC